MQIKINGKIILGIEEMHYLAMRCIFEKSKVSLEHQKMLEDSITWWSKFPNKDKSTTWEVKRIVNALIADEKGWFDRSKMLQIREKIDWHKMYKAGLPFVNVDEMTSFSKS